MRLSSVLLLLSYHEANSVPVKNEKYSERQIKISRAINEMKKRMETPFCK